MCDFCVPYYTKWIIYFMNESENQHDKNDSEPPENNYIYVAEK